MIYNHRFEVQAPLNAVSQFHSHSSSMGAITPPPVIVQIHHAPDILQEGDEMDFTMWLGPLPIRWVARIEDVSSTGFVDRQLRGPFTRWEHRHTFVPVNDTTTAVVDEVTAELSSNPFWHILGFGMWLNMAVLFAYRGWRTRQILARNAPATAQT